MSEERAADPARADDGKSESSFRSAESDNEEMDEKQVGSIGASASGGGLSIGQVTGFLRGMRSGSVDPDPTNLVLLSPEEEQEMVATLRKTLAEKCGGKLPADDFLLLCLRVWRYQENDAARIATNFVHFRRAAGWPFQISTQSACPALFTGMHWLLPGRDNAGRCVLVYNPRFLNPKLCGIADYQKMGCFVMQEVMKDLQTVDLGITVLVDVQGIDVLTLLPAFGIGDIQRGVGMWREAYPCKLKQIMVVNLTSTLRRIVDVALMALSSKIRKRITFARGDLRELYDLIPKDILPASLGGSGDVNWEAWCADRLGVSTPQ